MGCQQDCQALSPHRTSWMPNPNFSDGDGQRSPDYFKSHFQVVQILMILIPSLQAKVGKMEFAPKTTSNFTR